MFANAARISMSKSMKFRNPAIVFGGGINGLGITRNLGRAGVKVYCVIDRVNPAVFSKYCCKHFLLPDSTERKCQIRSFLNGFSARTTSRAVILSTDDLSTLILSDLQSEMKDDYHFVVPERDVAEKLIIKKKFYESLIKNRIPHPRVIIPTNPSDLRIASKELEYPIFIRPSISQYFNRLFRKKGFVANSEEELKKYYHLVSKYNVEVMFQEIVPGPDNNIYGISGFFNRRSEPLALFAYQRLRGWPLMFGNNSLIRSVALPKLPYMKDIINRYLKAMKYYGIMESEFKQDSRNGEFKLLEINARSWWQNSFPTTCGLNIILRAYLDAIGEKVEYSETYASGLEWIDFLSDVRSSIMGKEITKKRSLESFRRIRDFAYFSVGDPFPFASRMLYAGLEFISQKRYGLTSDHRLIPSEKRGEKNPPGSLYTR